MEYVVSTISDLNLEGNEKTRLPRGMRESVFMRHGCLNAQTRNVRYH